MAHSDLRLSVVRRMNASSTDISSLLESCCSNVFFSLNSSDQSGLFLLLIGTIKNVNGLDRKGMERSSQFLVTISLIRLFVYVTKTSAPFLLFSVKDEQEIRESERE